MAIKKWSPFERTIVVNNLPDGVGYIPTDRVYAMPTDKAGTSRRNSGCADAGLPASFNAMVNEILARGESGE